MTADGFTLHAIARALGMSGQPTAWTWDVLLDGAVRCYWRRRRPYVGPCDPGSAPGYRAHQTRRELPCQPCRDAHAMVKAIQRLRAQRAIAGAQSA